MEDPVAFRWLGVAGIELSTGEAVLLVDPCLTRIPFWRQWIGRVQPDHELVAAHIPRGDFVLVTHAHWDHLLDVPAVVQRTGAAVFGSDNTCQLLALLGVEAQRVRAGERLTLGDFRVEVRPARHVRVPFFAPGPLPAGLRPPLRARDYRMDEHFSFRIEVGGISLLTDPGTDAAQAALADVLLLGAHHPRRTVRALLARVRPRVVVPIHWDNLWRPLSRPARPLLGLRALRRTVQACAPGTIVFVPEILRSYNFNHEGHRGHEGF